MITDLILQHNAEVQEAVQAAQAHFEPLRSIFLTVRNKRIIKPGLWEWFRRLCNRETYEKELAVLLISYVVTPDRAVRVSVIFELGKWTHHYEGSSDWSANECVAEVSETFTLNDLKPDSNFESSAAVKTFINKLMFVGREYHRSEKYKGSI